MLCQSHEWSLWIFIFQYLRFILHFEKYKCLSGVGCNMRLLWYFSKYKIHTQPRFEKQQQYTSLLVHQSRISNQRKNYQLANLMRKLGKYFVKYNARIPRKWSNRVERFFVKIKYTQIVFVKSHLCHSSFALPVKFLKYQAQYLRVQIINFCSLRWQLLHLNSDFVHNLTFGSFLTGRFLFDLLLDITVRPVTDMVATNSCCGVGGCITTN